MAADSRGADPTPRSRVAARTWAGLAAIVVLGAAVRLHGIDFGLPHLLARPDEARIMDVANRALRGDWTPDALYYPPLFAQATAVIRRIAVRGGDDEATRHGRLFDSRTAYRIQRLLSALSGTLTLIFVYLLGRALASSAVGLTAAFLLALTHLHVRDSHFGVTDTTLALIVTAGLLASLRVLGARTWRRPALAGAAAGLACAIKYPGLLLLAPVAVAIILAFDPRRRPGRLALMLATATVSFLLVFALACPAAVADHARLVAEVWTEIRSKTSAGPGADLVRRGWIQHAALSLGYGLGAPLCVAAAAGALVTAARRPKEGVVLLAFAVTYYVAMGSGTIIHARYMLPLVPLLALFAAVAIDRVAHAARRSRRVWLAAALTAAVVSVSAARVVRSNRLLASEDTRVTAARYLDSLVADGERALLLGWYTRPATAICRGPRFVFEDDPSVARLVAGAEDPLRALTEAFDYVVHGSYYFGGEPRLGLDPDVRARLVDGLKSPLATISPLESGLSPSDVSPVFNDHDKIYLPYAGFEGFARPGPFIHVHRKDAAKAR